MSKASSDRGRRFFLKDMNDEVKAQKISSSQKEIQKLTKMWEMEKNLF